MKYDIMTAKEYYDYFMSVLSPKIFNKKEKSKRKYKPIIEFFLWNLKYFYNTNALSDFAKEELENLINVFEDE